MMLQKNPVIKHCSALLKKHDPNFDPESEAAQKQKAIDEKAKQDEAAKQKARLKDDSGTGLKRGAREIIN